MTEDLFDAIERNIYIRSDGVIVWESVLEKHVDSGNLKRILSLVGDHVTEDNRIDWAGVWREVAVG